MKNTEQSSLKKFLIDVKTKDKSIFEFIVHEKGEIIEKGMILAESHQHFDAIVHESTLKLLKKRKDVEIKIRGNIEDIGKSKQQLVGNGNRYLKNNKN